MSRLEKFVDRLANTQLAPDAFNQYAPGNPCNEIRRANLLHYFDHLDAHPPRTALIGEAPGYQGCRQTGISFTSEYLLQTGIPALGLFGPESEYRIANEFERLWKEPSSTIVWGALAELGIVPLIWAAFPFHPFEAGEPLSNRAPRKEEVELGKSFITEILALYPVERVLAVGNVASLSLANMNIEHTKIRHPSHGGKNDFVAGLKQYLI